MSAQITHALLHVSEPTETGNLATEVLVGLQDLLMEHWPNAASPTITCSISGDEDTAVYVLLTSEKQSCPAVYVSSEISVQNEIGASLKDLWQRYQDTGWTDLGLDWVKHPPLYPTSVTTNGILVLGINPSLNEKDLNLTSYKAKREVGPDYFGRLTRFMNTVEKQEQRFQAGFAAGATAEATVPWSHLDVLYVRETKQARFREEMGRAEVAQFIYEQALLTKQLIELVKPQLIIVANAFARELMGKDVNKDKTQGVWMGLKFTKEPDLHTGTYHCTSLPGSPPVFFTSSFAGSNPRSKSDDERLAWQIARCLHQLQTPGSLIALN